MTPETAKAMYRRRIGVGERVYIRRYTGSGSNRPFYDAPVIGKTIGFQPTDLIGGIVQGDQKVIVLADDLLAASIALPLTTADKVRIAGKEYSIKAPIPRKANGVLVAYELQISG